MDTRENTESVDITSRASVEEFLVSSWRHALSLEHIGVEDNFFEIGGDSLVALEVLVAIDEAIDTDVTITDLYERPTIRELADFITGVGVG
ncbi:phosphopantetheine-binding protein [Streptomyces sp. NPDC058459]|uniref:phosphopantetheine-binding protein n=1 Tax=Streptomyces sp. NPDC058459 TaxID=3346508 RepID=UPI003662346F